MNNKSRRTLHLIAGMYVFYLGIKLVNSFIKGADGNPIVSLVAGILFLAVGGFLIVDYIVKSKKAFEEAQKQEEDLIDGEATEVEDDQKEE